MFLQPVKPRNVTLLSTRLSPHQSCLITSINTFKNWRSESSPDLHLESTGSYCLLIMRTHLTLFFVSSTRKFFFFAGIYSNPLPLRCKTRIHLYQRWIAALCCPILSSCIWRSLTQLLSFCFCFLGLCCYFPRPTVWSLGWPWIGFLIFLS